MFVSLKRVFRYKRVSGGLNCGILLFVLLPLIVSAQGETVPVPPCGDVWGSRDDARAIQSAMLDGDEKSVTVAINKAKETRGKRVGCSEQTYAYDKPDFAEPKLETLTALWQARYEPGIAAFRIRCPTAAREWGFAALGGYYAALAGQKLDTRSLRDVGHLYEATQYKNKNSKLPAVATHGLFAYIAAAPKDPCFDDTNIAGTPLGEVINKICDSKRFPCTAYDAGIFKGKRFLVADTNKATQDFDGGAAYDHAIAGVMMIEAALQLPDPKDRKLFLDSAKLAGDWAVAETPVRNHNYTAKLVWLLAELYGLTGDERYKVAMLDKLHRNLIPGVLMDLDKDGKVDGMVDRSFKDLTIVAQRPGRIWDGHNARPTYHAMVAWAFVEAYVALRDRRQSAEAAKIRPYMLAMIDNIVWETNNLGVPSSGRPMIPYALLLALWKVSAVEGEPQPAWENAVRAFWNTGLFSAPNSGVHGEGSLNTGLYLLYRSGKKYNPLGQRNR